MAAKLWMHGKWKQEIKVAVKHHEKDQKMIMEIIGMMSQFVTNIWQKVIDVNSLDNVQSFY